MVSRRGVSLELNGHCHVIVTRSFDVFTLHGVSLVLHEINPVTDRLAAGAVDVAEGNSTRPVSNLRIHVGRRSGCIIRVSGVKLEFAVVIASDVETVLSSSGSFEKALHQVAVLFILIPVSFHHGCEIDGSWVGTVSQRGPVGGCSLVSRIDDRVLESKAARLSLGFGDRSCLAS